MHQTEHYFSRFFIWQAIVRGQSVSTEGPFFCKRHANIELFLQKQSFFPCLFYIFSDFINLDGLLPPDTKLEQEINYLSAV